MAVKCATALLFMLILNYVGTKNLRVFSALSNLQKNTYTKILKSHLDDPKVKFFCSNRDVHCNSNHSSVCTLRSLNDTFNYKEFENACYLFLSNMCDQPGQEYYIVGTGSCDNYLYIKRRNEDIEKSSKEFKNNYNGSVENVDNTKYINVNNENISKRAEYEYNNSKNGTNYDDSVNNSSKNENNSNKNADNNRGNIKVNDIKTFRKRKRSDLRTVLDAYDEHPCPKACPETYSPVCVNVNRGYGKYFKMYTFLNHCKADFYYCNNTSEFDPPPDESAEMVYSSPLSWSYCGASRYLQFARFAEVTSSMGHYGWLSGNYGYAHIMEPHERLPGHG